MRYWHAWFSNDIVISFLLLLCLDVIFKYPFNIFKQTPQTPLVRPRAHDEFNVDNYPLGTNAVVAVISYTVCISV